MSNDSTHRNSPSRDGSHAELQARVRQLEESMKATQAAFSALQGSYQSVVARLALVEHRMLAMDYAPVPSATASTTAGNHGGDVSSTAGANGSTGGAAASSTSAATSATAKPAREPNLANRQLEEELQRLGLSPATSGFAAAAQNDPATLSLEPQPPSPESSLTGFAKSPPQVAVSVSQPPPPPPQPMSGGFMPGMMGPRSTGQASPGLGTTPNTMVPVEGVFNGSPMSAQPPAMFPRMGMAPTVMPNAMFADPYFMAAYAAQQQQPSPSGMGLNGYAMMPHMVPAGMPMHGPTNNTNNAGSNTNNAGAASHNNSTTNAVNNNNNNNAGGASASAAGGGGGAGSPAASVVVIDPARASNEMLDRVCQQNQHQYVKDLCLKGCKAITNFTPLSRLRNLWKLNLQGCSQSVDDSVVKLIGSCNTRISRLNLCGCERVTDATPLAQLAYLFDLNLSGCQIGNASLLAISGGCGQLSRLAINSCPLVTSIACCGNLKELKLLYCRYSANITPASISSVLAVIGQNLLTLNVDGVKFSALDLQNLPATTALKNFNLKDNTELTDLAWLTSVPDASRVFGALETLDMEGCEHLARLGDLAQLPGLKTLRLSGTAVSVEELQKLAQSPTVRLHTLYVDGCAGLTDLSCLASMRSLTKLVVDGATQGTSARALPAAASGQLDVVTAQPNRGNNGSPTSAHPPSGRSPTSAAPSAGGANLAPVLAPGGGAAAAHHGGNLAVGSGYFGSSGSHGYLTPSGISPFTSPTVFTVPPMPTMDY